MYTDFYKLSDLPFRLSPDRRFFFGSESHRKAMSYLLYGIYQNEGFVVVTGDVGTGKSTLVECLLAQLDRDRYAVAHVVTSQLEPSAMLDVVAAAFGLSLPASNKARVLAAIENRLHELHRQGKLPVLIVDEAQNLPLETLEELRMLSNFSVGHSAALQVVLLGQPEFRDIIARPELEQLRQRVIASHHLTPLNEQDTRGYIEHRLRTVGWRDDPHFDDDAFHKIYDATGGLPREINRLCSRILVYGSLEEAHIVDVVTVTEVAEELRDELPPKSAPGEAYQALSSSLLEARVRSLEAEVDTHKRILRRALHLMGRYLQSRPGNNSHCSSGLNGARSAPDARRDDADDDS